MQDEDIIAALLPEPDDGAVLVVDYGHNDWRVIWRDDANPSSHGTDRWFDDTHSAPLPLYEHVKHVQAVYLLGEMLAVFR